mmetsp:Transcript_4920/g.15816  ORF Transcript_4920/g.15816 Transcript_4920/m.15816 type:complete len:162 (+) Transcript_4920:3-488(+)
MAPSAISFSGTHPCVMTPAQRRAALADLAAAGVGAKGCSKHMHMHCLPMDDLLPVLIIDNAPSHSSHQSQLLYEKLLRDKSCKVILQPPNSPDLSPLDFWFWSVLKAKMPRVFTEDALHIAINTTYTKTLLHEATYIQLVAEWFEKRLDRCIAAGGGHFEL